jgi:glyceraldehyde 3-phosphate dehydrogenase
VAINHTCASVEDVAYLIEHDSTHGPLSKLNHSKSPFHVSIISDNVISINGRSIALLSQRDIRRIDWSIYGAEYVAECTGKFTKSALAIDHIEYARARKVIISAPSDDAATFVFGVNSAEYSKQHRPDVVSCASCTTNCVAPVVKVINDNFGLAQAFMTTVHASTPSQSVLDGYSRRDRRSGKLHHSLLVHPSN